MILRVVSALAAAGILAAGVALADSVPVHTPAPPTVEHSLVAPLTHSVACPGPLHIPVGDISSGDKNLDSGSDDVKLEVFAADETTPVGEGVASTESVAATLERVGGGDIAGLAGVTCVRPSLDQWLVGGATTVGASARLVLTNPADAPVEVTITAYGPIQSDGEPKVIVVGPRSQETTLLEGTIPENPALVLHIESSGTGVVAQVQDSRLDGFAPVGTDWVGRGANPATSIVIPAVGPTDATDSSATVSMLAPDGATVSLTLVTADGIVTWPGTAGLVLEPGVVTEIPVPAMAAGAVEIEADAPVVAAGYTRLPTSAQSGRGDALAFDSMWVAGQAVTETSTSTTAVTDAPVLSVYSATHQSLSVTNQSGEVVATADVPARSAQRVTVDASAGDVLTIVGRAAWAQVVVGQEGFVTALAPAETELADQDVSVTVGSYVPVP